MTNKTTMVDIFEAAGGSVSEDRTMVDINGPYQPFDIALRVVPTGMERDSYGVPRITFAVLLHDEFAVEGSVFHQVEHRAEIVLPADQVRILKEKNEQPR